MPRGERYPDDGFFLCALARRCWKSKPNWMMAAWAEFYACNTTNQGQMPIKRRQWFVDKELAGGGAVMDHTVHLTDILRWYFDTEVVEVFAQTNHILHAGAVDVENGWFSHVDPGQWYICQYRPAAGANP